MGAVTDVLFSGPTVTVDGDCSMRWEDSCFLGGKL